MKENTRAAECTAGLIHNHAAGILVVMVLAKTHKMPHAQQRRLVPISVASPLFLQNLDSSAMTTALPSIAHSLNVPPLHLNLAITAYLLSLAIFLPVSAWLADRCGPRRVFCVAIATFSLGSALCGIADPLPTMVLFRALQGLGGAMMVPFGRLILLRAVPLKRAGDATPLADGIGR